MSFETDMNNTDEKSSLASDKTQADRVGSDKNDKTLNIVCVSDTHNGHDVVTKQVLSLLKKDASYVNILVHCGDMTEHGSKDELLRVKKWFESFENKFDHIICIAGNMDGIGLENDRDHDKIKNNNYNYNHYYNYNSTSSFDSYHNALDGHKLFDSGKIHYLESESITINGCKFYGLPYTPKFYGGFQLKNEKHCKQIYDKIDLDTDILISHGPAKNILDQTSRGKHAGCPILANYIFSRIKPSAMVFGHIHPSFGMQQVEIRKDQSVMFFNCALHDAIYGGTNRNLNTSHISPLSFSFDPKSGKTWLEC